MRQPPSTPAATPERWSGGERSRQDPETGAGTGNGVGADRFRAAMARHAAGVVVVTAAPEESGPVGLTATSFTSVSLDPPLVSFYVGAGSSVWPGLRDATAFAVNLLAEGQHDVAARFARRGVDRFAAPTRWSRGPAGVPLLGGAAGHVVCRRHDVLAVGDHWLVVGRVAAARLPEDHASGSADAPRPLLYHRGRYGGFTELGA